MLVNDKLSMGDVDICLGILSDRKQVCGHTCTDCSSQTELNFANTVHTCVLTSCVLHASSVHSQH